MADHPEYPQADDHLDDRQEEDHPEHHQAGDHQAVDHLADHHTAPGPLKSRCPGPLGCKLLGQLSIYEKTQKNV